MLIVFLYLIFLTLGGVERSFIRLNEDEKWERIKKNSSLYQIVIIIIIIFLFFKLNFFLEKENLWIREIISLGAEAQEFYRLFISISYKTIFRILLLVIRVSLFLYLGILNKKMLQSKVSFFSFYYKKLYEISNFKIST